MIFERPGFYHIPAVPSTAAFFKGQTLKFAIDYMRQWTAFFRKSYAEAEAAASGK